MLEMVLKIRGKVQRVGFRYSVVEFVQNTQLPVYGYVRNLPDGSVEILAQGDIENLKSLHRFATKGPPGAEVREVDEDLHPLNKLTHQDFVIID
ncbi:MAG: acylphosphatase [Bacteriovoracaceae bacterium]